MRICFLPVSTVYLSHIIRAAIETDGEVFVTRKGTIVVAEPWNPPPRSKLLPADPHSIALKKCYQSLLK